MPDLGGELHLGRLEGVGGRDDDVDLEDAACCVFGLCGWVGGDYMRVFVCVFMCGCGWVCGREGRELGREEEEDDDDDGHYHHHHDDDRAAVRQRR